VLLRDTHVVAEPHQLGAESERVVRCGLGAYERVLDEEVNRPGF